MITRDYYLYLRMCYLDCVFKQLLGNDHQIYSLIGDNGGVPSFRFQKSELAEWMSRSWTGYISKIYSMIHYCNGICISTMGFVIYQFLISMLSMFLLKRDLEYIPLESKANLNLRINKCTKIILYITHFCFLFAIKIINVVEQWNWHCTWVHVCKVYIIYNIALCINWAK